MQDTPVVTNNIERKAGEISELWIHKLPEELVGLIPDSVWSSISLEQKKEIMRQNGILEKYTVKSVNPQAESAPQPVQESIVSVPVQETSPELNSPLVEQSPSMNKESQEFATLVESVKSNELNVQDIGEKSSPEESKEAELTAEDKNRIVQETASAVNNQTFKLGYQVDEDTVNNSSNISKTGDISDGKTWAATLLGKIFAIFGE